MPSTRAQALDQIIELSIRSDVIRGLLGEVALRTIYALRDDPLTRCTMDSALRTTARRALISLEESRVHSILKVYRYSDWETQQMLAKQLEPYL